MLAQLDASAVRRWCSAADRAMTARQAEIDDLNVFPIPDGDTGTNLSLTLHSAAAAVDTDRSATPGSVLAAMARGAVMGARGNSGVIVSQILQAMADSFGAAAAEIGGADVGRALTAAADAADAAVADPVEGTILSVIRAAAQGATTAEGDLADTVRGCQQAAAQALARTPEQLPVLAQAGVVDAGGQGLLVLLDALAGVVLGSRDETSAASEGDTRADSPARRLRPDVADPSSSEVHREAGSPEYAYEVQYLLYGSDPAATRLKDQLVELGDSVVVVGAGSPEGSAGRVFNVHVHVNDVGAAIEAGIEAGRPHRITVVRFADQIAAQLAASAQAAERTGVAVLAVAPGPGLAEVFHAEGVYVVDGGPTQNPSTAEVLEAIQSTGAARVVVLPNASAVGAVADLAAERARADGIEVAVVPTKSPVQGLAAVAVHDPRRRFADDVIAMAEAAAATRFAEVTVAVRESITYAGRCQAGDVLGLIDGEVVEIGSDYGTVGVSLVGRLISAGGELVTVLAGADPAGALACETVERYVRTQHPLVEITALPGGQPHFPLLIGVE
ncbi:DAK2 domain-containing protein [Jatrophihabitans telluris]|uniref:DAK2 domain-containing protein n=1 Tax=Jatrophihabitans telluris TaxID=2038343 RepID=A0ABY4R5B2_9ACTN|nr:DAK2 domain-containing protein [Jatrophihabitans telluris]UQX89964.1 DAK2 domain-containing protein [Jatrophihabitans telluris]